MKFADYITIIKSDLYRYTGKVNLYIFMFHLLRNPGFKYTFWMRTCSFLQNRRLIKIALFLFARLILEHYEYKYGISIPYKTEIGQGLYIGHFGGIVVNHRAKIGKNCNISHGVTIGQSNRGNRKGYPIIGDNVFIGPGAKIIGGICIGNEVAIGANSVVTKDVNDHEVVIGIPAKVISNKGSEGYITRTDY